MSEPGSDSNLRSGTLGPYASGRYATRELPPVPAAKPLPESRFGWPAKFAATVAACGLLYALLLLIRKPEARSATGAKARTPVSGRKESKARKKRSARPAPAAARPPDPARLSVQEEVPEWELEIVRRMQRPVSFEFENRELEKCLAFLSGRCRVDLVMEPEAARAGAGRLLIGMKAVDMPMAAALDRLCEMSESAYRLTNQCVYLFPIRDEPEAVPHFTAASGWKPHAELERKVSFSFVQTPFEEVCAFIVSLNTLPLKAEAVQKAPPITLRVSDMTLYMAMEWIGRVSGVRFELKDNEMLALPAPGGAGGWKTEDRPLAPPAEANLEARLALRAELRAGRITRREMLQRITEDAGIPLELSALAEESAAEWVTVPSGPRSIATFLSRAIKGARPPLGLTRAGAKLAVRALSVDELLDQPYAEQLASSGGEVKATALLKSIAAAAGITRLDWDQDQLDPRVMSVWVESLPENLTCRQALDELCASAGWTYRAEQDRLVLALVPE